MASLTRGDALAGQVLGDTYRLLRRIGEGGMGVVYEACHVRQPGEHFAVKLLLPAAVDDSAKLARFRREAKVAISLAHPNVVRVFDFSVTSTGQPYLVMELLEGESLSQLLARRGSLRPSEVLQLVDQAGVALQVAHAQGVVHRDLKPENIFSERAGRGGIRVKLLDFGLAKIAGDYTKLTSEFSVFGTPHYMSPEQAEGLTAEVDHSSDIFAFGVICYQCLSGRVPFDGPSIPGILYQVCHFEPPKVSDLVPGLPSAAGGVLARAMAKRKVDRYQCVEDFVCDLRQALGETVPVALGHVDTEVDTTLPISVAPSAAGNVVPGAEDKTVTSAPRARRRLVALAFFGLGLLALAVTVATVTARWNAAAPLAAHSYPTVDFGSSARDALDGATSYDSRAPALDLRGRRLDSGGRADALSANVTSEIILYDEAIGKTESGDISQPTRRRVKSSRRLSPSSRRVKKVVGPPEAPVEKGPTKKMRYEDL